jgi:hypothetical protein
LIYIPSFIYDPIICYIVPLGYLKYIPPKSAIPLGKSVIIIFGKLREYLNQKPYPN